MNFNILKYTIIFCLFIYSKILMGTLYLPGTVIYYGDQDRHVPFIHKDIVHEDDM